MSKTFDKVWHEGLIYKLRQVAISGEAVAFINSFLNDRFQRVILIGQSSNWFALKAGVLQGSILGPLFFLVYIHVNDYWKILPPQSNSLHITHPFFVL